LRPDAEVFANYSGGKYGRGRSASAARVARLGAKLLKPIFQRKCLLWLRLWLRLDVPVGRAHSASRLGVRSAVPREGLEIG
jgi:hypothetical protein